MLDSSSSGTVCKRIREDTWSSGQANVLIIAAEINDIINFK
jgi:hypothetical protein